MEAEDGRGAGRRKSPEAVPEESMAETEACPKPDSIAFSGAQDAIMPNRNMTSQEPREN